MSEASVYTPDSPGDSTERIQAFSDGVFAVAITLLILNIQVPHLDDNQRLIDALIRLWPAYLSYFLSFLTIGIVWANHHQTFQFIVRGNHGLRMLNIFLLMTVTLIPFTTAVLSEYIERPADQQAAAAVYALGWLLLSIAYNLLWQYAVRARLLDPRLTMRQIGVIKRRTFLGAVLYAVAVIVAAFSAALSILICFGLAVYYLVPIRAWPGARPVPSPNGDSVPLDDPGTG